MSHDHTDCHGHHGHDHKETLTQRRNRYGRSTLLGFLLALSQILILTFLIKGSFGGESDTGHVLVDSNNNLFGLIVIILLTRNLISPKRAEKLGVWVNSFFYFIGAGYIFYEISKGERFHHLPWGWLLLLGAVGFVGNYIQHKVFGHHGEGTNAQDRATEGHILYDLLNSAFVMMMAFFIFLISLPLFPLIKAYIAFLTVIASVFIIVGNYLPYSQWKPWQWTLCYGGVALLTGCVTYLVFKAQVGYIDILLGALIASGMAVTGIVILLNPDAHRH